ncbi:Meiotic cell cortex C-terminal pleckstrin homology, putative [Trypanosoma equiperdum]|uniref:Pleckstrin homology domain-containing protein n=2 Tax=Trypanozoon TaxID=39700 RepID=Q586T9_TRYB2|nr:hypothetical protein, conserved [Trypanosoma brucei brucei TREU927]AAQ15959.1 hypothetical protein, conserved [Trypanosoma brucei brucei TREU927]AAX80148.1 hypothetical protein, conserved [Trypanosoma brucei]SCU65374.1 Meiotic cell cortex C-terminal pleckstrin homology, putative [Trypanosoma equiperdum]
MDAVHEAHLEKILERRRRRNAPNAAVTISCSPPAGAATDEQVQAIEGTETRRASSATSPKDLVSGNRPRAQEAVDAVPEVTRTCNSSAHSAEPTRGGAEDDRCVPCLVINVSTYPDSDSNRRRFTMLSTDTGYCSFPISPHGNPRGNGNCEGSRWEAACHRTNSLYSSVNGERGAINTVTALYDEFPIGRTVPQLSYSKPEACFNPSGENTNDLSMRRFGSPGRCVVRLVHRQPLEEACVQPLRYDSPNCTPVSRTGHADSLAVCPIFSLDTPRRGERVQHLQNTISRDTGKLEGDRLQSGELFLEAEEPKPLPAPLQVSPLPGAQGGVGTVSLRPNALTRLPVDELRLTTYAPVSLLCGGDWFYKWSSRAGTCSPRWVWVDIVNLFLLWAHWETFETTFARKIRLDHITRVCYKETCESEEVECRSPTRAPRTPHTLLVKTSRRLLRLSTESKSKADIWCKALANLLSHLTSPRSQATMSSDDPVAAITQLDDQSAHVV